MFIAMTTLRVLSVPEIEPPSAEPCVLLLPDTGSIMPYSNCTPETGSFTTVVK